MSSFKRILVTSALPYANGPLHIGHIAGAYLPSDLYTRFKRLNGESIIHICGSDEHGVPITIAAEKQGCTPQEIVDRYHELNKATFEKFGISFDYYGRTSSKTHYETASEFFSTLDKKGVFVRKQEKQLFDIEKEMFLPDRYVKGTCPSCGFNEAYGDQCEKCGKSLSPDELIDPISVLSGTKPELRETEHWFLPLGSYQEELENWITSHREWKSNVLGQVQSWLQAGLSDRAVTRDLTWGVPVPHPDAKGKVLYVWFDAPIGYISATKEWAQKNGTPEDWSKWWQDSSTRLIHFIGKDNIVFHCVIFPVMLKAHGDYILPDQVPANEFLNLEGNKLSTSRNWAIWLHEVIEEFEPDLFRYVIASILPESKDADFSWKDFQQRVNSELADVLGNFTNRTLTFIERFAEGKIPSNASLTQRDQDALRVIEIQKEKISRAYESFHFREAVQETMHLAREGNRYFSESEPWKTRTDNPDQCNATLYVSAQIAAALSILFDPVMPEKMKQLRSALGITGEIHWQNVTSEMLKVGTEISSGEILFAKVEDEKIQKQLDKLNYGAGIPSLEAEDESARISPISTEIEFDQFLPIDLRAAKIEAAETVPKSDKLLKLTLDLGLEKRTILSGVAKHISAEELIGKTVVIVSNLKPRKMMGMESQGMVLFAEEPDGTLKPVVTEATPGSCVK